MEKDVKISSDVVELTRSCNLLYQLEWQTLGYFISTLSLPLVPEQKDIGDELFVSIDIYTTWDWYCCDTFLKFVSHRWITVKYEQVWVRNSACILIYPNIMHHWLLLKKVQWHDAFTKSASIQYGEKKKLLILCYVVACPYF